MAGDTIGQVKFSLGLDKKPFEKGLKEVQKDAEKNGSLFAPLKGATKDIKNIFSYFSKSLAMKGTSVGITKMAEAGEKFADEIKKAHEEVTKCEDEIKKTQELADKGLIDSSVLDQQKQKLEQLKQACEDIGKRILSEKTFGKKGLFKFNFPAPPVKLASALAKLGKVGKVAFRAIRVSAKIAYATISGMLTASVYVLSGAFLALRKAGELAFRALKYGAKALAVAMVALATAMVALGKQGFENLIAYDKQTATSLNNIKSALDGLRNALASAFAPIFNFVAPALVTLINLLTRAMNAIAGFFSALTGGKSVVIAKKNVGGYSSGLGGAAKNAGKAAKAQKKLNRTLMGFDKINKLDKKDKGAGGGGAGGGGAGGLGGAGGMFETVPINKKIKDFAKKFKDAWKKADFYWLGKLLAKKLNKALAKIPWNKIKKTVAKIAKSIATFLNGFIENADWKLIGKTFAEGLNTGFEFAYAYITNFHFDSFGKAIGNTINGFVENIDWKKIYGSLNGFGKGIAETLSNAIRTTDWAGVARAITNGVKAIMDMASSFLANVDWKAVGQAIITYMTNIDWRSLFSTASGLVGNIVGALAGILFGVAKQIGSMVKEYFAESMEEVGGNIIKGLLHGIAKAVSGIGEWIVTKLFIPFIKGFKKAFGISSPSKVMKKQGKNIIAGLLLGLKDALGDVLKWLGKLPGKLLGKIKEKVAGIKKLAIVKAVKKATKAIKAFTKYAKGKLLKAMKLLKKPMQTVSKYWNSLKNKKATLTAKLKNNIKTKTLNKLTNAFSTIKTKTAEFTIKFKAEMMKGYNNFATKVNNLLAKLPKKIRPGWRLPKFAQGGYVQRNTPQLAVVGDNKREGEVISPESKLRAMAREVAQESGGADAQVVRLLTQLLTAVRNLNTNVYLDGKEITNNTINRINQRTRTTGKFPLIV